MSDRPVIEVVGPWLHNSGDVLTLWAVARRLAPQADLAASSALGLDELPPEPKLRRICWPIDRTAAREALRRRSPALALRCAADSATVAIPGGDGRRAQQRGIVAGRQISALVDCSGYAYGDTWGIERVRARTAHYRRLTRAGARIIFLPQAFGPFQDVEKRDACRHLFELADLIYARDSASLEHLRELNLAAEVAGPVPDITHSLLSRLPADAASWKRRVCIIPNARMLDRTDPETAANYFSFMVSAMRMARRHSLEPVLLVHEANDRPLAERLAAVDQVRTPVIVEDALVARGMIGASRAVIGARYHALISALAQGVPALATSWSHKYEQLFADYRRPEWVMPVNSGPEAVTHFLRAVADSTTRQQLQLASDRQRIEVEAMWNRVEAMLRETQLAPAPAALAPAGAGVS